MNKICIGILSLTPGWQSLLDQIGACYEELKHDKPFEKNYSVLIINKTPTNRLLKKLNVFLQSNGSILVTKDAKSTRFFYERRILPPPTIYTDFKELISFSIVGDGMVCDLNFNPDNHISNNHFSRQRFYFKKNKHPDELVSTVDKEALHDAVLTCLKHLHFHRDLPFVRKWISPEKKPVFGFRIDSDYGDQQSIKNLYQVANEFNIPMTWFLHVEAHEHWLEYFHEFKNQEIALHGYEHGTSKSFEHIINNIEIGRQKLLDAGFNPSGFCAPYGIWNEALADVLESQDFAYSSEFTIGYDSLPFQPIHNENLHPTLQIPIHPICTGSLNRKHVSDEELIDYFINTINARINENRNTFFYHHPLQRGLNVWKQVFQVVNEMELSKCTFLEFAEFWNARNSFQLEPIFDTKRKNFYLESSNNELYIQVSMDHESFYIMKAAQTNVPLTNFEKYFVDAQYPQLSNSQKAELSEQPIELMKTSLLDWKNRKKL